MSLPTISIHEIYDLLKEDRRVWTTKEIASRYLDLETLNHEHRSEIVSNVNCRCNRLARQGHLEHPDKFSWRFKD